MKIKGWIKNEYEDMRASLSERIVVHFLRHKNYVPIIKVWNSIPNSLQNRVCRSLNAGMKCYPGDSKFADAVIRIAEIDDSSAHVTDFHDWNEILRRTSIEPSNISSKLYAKLLEMPDVYYNAWNKMPVEFQTEALFRKVLDSLKEEHIFSHADVFNTLRPDILERNPNFLSEIVEEYSDSPEKIIEIFTEFKDVCKRNPEMVDKIFGILVKNEPESAGFVLSSSEQRLEYIQKYYNNPDVVYSIWISGGYEFRISNLDLLKTFVDDPNYKEKMFHFWKSSPKEVQKGNAGLLSKIFAKSATYQPHLLQAWLDTSIDLQMQNAQLLESVVENELLNHGMSLVNLWKKTDRNIQVSNSYLFERVLTGCPSDDDRVYIWENTDAELQGKYLTRIFELSHNKKSRDGIWSNTDFNVIKDNLDFLLEKFGMTKNKDLILELAKSNEDVLKYPPYLIDGFYIDILGADKVCKLSSYPDIISQFRAIKANENGDKIIQFIGKSINQYIYENNDDYGWPFFTDKLLQNITSYMKLLSSLDFNSLDDGTLSKLNNILISKNILEIENFEDINNYEKIVQDRCNQLIQSSDLNDRKSAVLISKFGLQLDDCERIIESYGKDIDAIEDENLKAFIKSMEAICNIEKKDELALERIYNEVEPVGHKDTIQVERMLRTEYGKLYNKVLFDPKKDGNEIEPNVYETGSHFFMNITSIGGYIKNAVDDYYLDWNRPSLSSPHFCTSNITNDMLGTAPVPNICFGFSSQEPSSFVLTAPGDINSSKGKSMISQSFGDVSFLAPENQINETRLHNESDYLRFQNGERKQPDYIVVFKYKDKTPNMDVAKKASEDFKRNNPERYPDGLPIVVVDIDKCLEEQQEKIDSLTKENAEHPSIELIDKLILEYQKRCCTLRTLETKNFESDEYEPSRIFTIEGELREKKEKMKEDKLSDEKNKDNSFLSRVLHQPFKTLIPRKALTQNDTLVSPVERKEVNETFRRILQITNETRKEPERE